MASSSPTAGQATVAAPGAESGAAQASSAGDGRRWRRERLLPVALGALWPLALCGRLLSPAAALANRDIAGFHLPLRGSLVRLATLGSPSWNPWLGGGQPVLSNPNYAAFYPPTWLAWPCGPLYSLNLLVLSHLAIAFAGAWLLARRLGCGRGAAALAAIGYSGSGANLSLLNAFGTLTSMAWLPWVLAGAVAAVERQERRRWVPAVVLAAVALALQVLNGDPVCEVMSVIALLLIALSNLRRRPWRSARLMAVVLLALGLSAVQLLPALQRLGDSVRGQGLAANPASRGWSLPPQRLAELAFPRLFGDAARLDEGLYFGSRLDERGRPYLTSIYPGLLLTLLGLGALFLPRLPLRWVWIGGIAAGIFLALAQHNPLYGAARLLAPPLAAMRFPEKFVLLPVACLVFAGALGWQQLQRPVGEKASGPDIGRWRRAPLALALACTGAAAVGALLLFEAPTAALAALRAFGLETPAMALPLLRREALAGLLTAAAAAAILEAQRRAARPEGRRGGQAAHLARAVAAAAVLFLALDLWHYGHGLVAVVPASEYAAAPRLARAVPAGGAIFTEADDNAIPRLLQPGVPRAVARLRAELVRFEPMTPMLWGIPYALAPDYDLTATRWNRLAWGAIERERRSGPDLSPQLEGAWGAAVRLLPKPALAWRREAAVDPAAPPLWAAVDPYRLARWRFVPEVTFHSSYRGALAAARAEGYRVGLAEHCAAAAPADRTVRFAGDARLLTLADQGGRIVLRYTASRPAFLVVATTFDPGWRAVAGGEPQPVLPTALAQLATILPPGDHTAELTYHQPRLHLGITLSLLALLVACVALLWSRHGDDVPRPTTSSTPVPEVEVR